MTSAATATIQRTVRDNLDSYFFSAGFAGTGGGPFDNVAVSATVLVAGDTRT
jgi:hypothetical protein